MYARCGSFEEASRSFNTFPYRDVVSWNAFMSACIEHESNVLALECFRNMQTDASLSPNKISFMLAVRACGAQDDTWHGRLIHKHIIMSSMIIDETCGSSLIDMYAKCGDLDDAYRLFRDLPYKNVFSWGALMSGYVQHGRNSVALDLFKDMENEGVWPTPPIFSCLLKACGSIRALWKGKLVHSQIVQHGLASDPITNNALIDMYAKCGEFTAANKVLCMVPVQNERSYGAIIGGYIQQGHPSSALHLFVEMQTRGLNPNQVIYSSVLIACSHLRDSDKGRLLHHCILADSMESSETVSQSLVSMYSSFGSLAEARKVYGNIRGFNQSACDAMIAGYIKHEENELAIKFFQKIQYQGIKPSETMFSCALKACGGIRDLIRGRSVHAHIVIDLFKPDVVIINSIIDMYLSCGSLKEAKRAFETSRDCDVVSWNSLLGGYIEYGLISSALDLFNKMYKSDIKPDRVTFLCILKACNNIGALREGRIMYNQIVEGSFESDIAVKISLVSMFARCGSLQEARKLVLATAQSEPGAWAALIAGYAQGGECKLARDCFYEMVEHGVNPDIAAFTVILTSCCHAGDVDEGYWFFNAMKDYSLVPRIEHFNCLIDLLGRTGRLNEARGLFDIMPSFPDVMGWMSLLTACKRYGDAELGRKCVEEILRIDPENSAVFTLMSDTYAGHYRWEDACGLEKLRSYANAWKKPAVAWIQIEDQLHEFTIEEGNRDQDYPFEQRLKSLKWQMEDAGYVPNVDIMLGEKSINVSEISRGRDKRCSSEVANCMGNNDDANSKKLLVGFDSLRPFKGASVRLIKVIGLSGTERFQTSSTSKYIKKEIIIRQFLSINTLTFDRLHENPLISHISINDMDGTFMFLYSIKRESFNFTYLMRLFQDGQSC
ncbi:hypothetical protein KP509_23G046500 [Ceratopteris richardii]|nr:hypothetical protein KP509_23G046500 [Ceratopteris richardii]KAH7301858.1 hypothetical protein KP509_23G046500 [Ceratopteris richardii]KAH7301859.1 hypothetical protein KP509_23G046500 [Ceratopteris richardii]